MNRPFLIFGTSVLSRLLLELLPEEKTRLLAGFCVARDYILDDQFCGYPVHAFEEVERHCAPDRHDMIIPLRYSKMNKLREAIFNAAVEKGYDLPGFIHPSCLISPEAKIGRNVIMFQSCVVRSDAQIEDNSILWNRVLVESGAGIGAHCFIAGGAILQTDCRIGPNSFVGPKNTIESGCIVGRECVIGTGGLVQSHCQDGAIFGAAPARYL